MISSPKMSKFEHHIAVRIKLVSTSNLSQISGKNLFILLIPRLFSTSQ
jgi:hypothetical protein